MATTNWNLDPAHSQVSFKIKHMMITNVTGYFENFTSTLVTEDEDFSKSAIDFSAELASINTRNEGRDQHLKSADFFDAEQFPTIQFKGTKYEVTGSDSAKLTGDLTIKDVTKSVTLDVEHLGLGKDPWGNIKTGFSINGKIKRSEFGLTWNAALETGGVMVSDDVKINAEVQFVKA